MSADPKPVIVYADPFGAGHHVEHMAFYLRVCASLGVTLRAHVPASMWAQAVRLAGSPGEGAILARDVAAPGRRFWTLNRVLGDAFRDARDHHARLVYLPMLDNFFAPLVLRRLLGWRAPAAWTGVFFRDTFNFPQDEVGRWRARATSWVKRRLLRWILAGDAAGLLTLNPAWQAPMPVPVTWLPDAMSSLDGMAERAAAAEGWPLAKTTPDDGKLRLLMFGALAPRKGLKAFAQGLLRLDDGELQRIELKVLGRFFVDDFDYQAQCEAALAAVSARGVSVQAVTHHVPEAMLDAALRWTDVLLAPYIGHTGSSGQVALAAQYGRPMLAQGAYQVGADVRRWDLGLTLDASDPDAVAAAVRRMMAGGMGASEGMGALRERLNGSGAFAVAAKVIGDLVRAGS